MIVVTLDFLVPATVLGMVGPVVAKMAVEQAQRTGSAIGDVYFCGAIGSIVGTFLAGFVLMYLAPYLDHRPAGRGGAGTAGRGSLRRHRGGLVLGCVTALLAWSGIDRSPGPIAGPGGIDLGSYQINYLALAGNVDGRRCSVCWRSPACSRPGGEDLALGSKATKRRRIEPSPPRLRPSLSDLAVLAFLASLAFMALEMVAGRLVTRHLGSSIYGWTSVIAVLLAGLEPGQLPGRAGRQPDQEREAGELALPGRVGPHRSASCC